MPPAPSSRRSRRLHVPFRTVTLHPATVRLHHATSPGKCPLPSVQVHFPAGPSEAPLFTLTFVFAPLDPTKSRHKVSLSPCFGLPYRIIFQTTSLCPSHTKVLHVSRIFNLSNATATERALGGINNAPPPQDVHVLVPETWSMLPPRGRRDFSLAIKSRILRSLGRSSWIIQGSPV